MLTGRLRLVLLGALLVWPLAAQAEILTFAMEGSVTVIQDPTGALDWVNLGDRVVYTFTFDSNAPDQNPTANVGSYAFLASTLAVNGGIIPSSPGGILIGHPLDTFIVGSSVAIPGLTNAGAEFTLDDQVESSALTDTSLPSEPYDLSLFAYSGFLIQGLGPPIPPDTYPSISNFQGRIDQFYVVPEPSTILFLCVGCFIVRHRTRRRL